MEGGGRREGGGGEINRGLDKCVGVSSTYIFQREIFLWRLFRSMVGLEVCQSRNHHLDETWNGQREMEEVVPLKQAPPTQSLTSRFLQYGLRSTR